MQYPKDILEVTYVNLICNTLMGVLGLRVGLMEYVLFCPEGIARQKCKCNTIIIHI
jgi:hypothetical protein